MYELKAYDFHGKKVIDSRDVARMVERPHNDLMKSIRQYVKYLNEGEISQVDFFVESTYIASNGQEQPKFLITKKGCDMVANKLPGKKGVLFTAAYVTAFEEMQKVLAVPQKRVSLPEGVSLSGMARLISVTRRAMLDAGSTPLDVCGMIKETYEAVGFPVPSVFPKQLPGQMSLFDRPALGS